MPAANALGEYLRARRELMSPADVGLSATGVRRTPGLRREEVATLAGISADYYLRLEQGRDRNPSPQVLEALARVLRLDETATAYLLTLGAARTKRRAPRRQKVPTGIAQLVDAMPLPAFVESRTLDILAANSRATALFPSVVVGANRLRSVFLDESEQRMFPDFERVAAGFIAAFRVSIGAGHDDPETAQLVGELSLGSELFGRLWARHDVKPLAGGFVPLDHPVVGRLDLYREKLPLADTDGQILAIYHAEPGSVSERLLATLGGDDASVSDPTATMEA